MAELPQVKQDKLRKLLLAQQATGVTDEAIAREVGVSKRTVSNWKAKVASELEADAGAKVTRATLNERISRAQAVDWNTPDVDARSILAAYPDAEQLTSEEVLRLFSILALHGPDSGKVAAGRAYMDAQRLYQTQENLGPKEPLTEEDKVARLSRLMEGVGPHITRLAVERTWPDTPASQKDRSPSQSGGTTPTTSKATSEAPRPSAPSAPDAPASDARSAGSSETTPGTSSSQPPSTPSD